MAAPSHNTSGMLKPLVVGNIIDVWLLGCTMIQAHRYLFLSTDEKFIYRLAVFFLYILNIFHTASICTLLFSIDNQTQPPKWPFDIAPALLGVSTLIVHSYFCWMIFMFLKRRYYVWPAAIMLTSVFSSVLAIDLVVLSFKGHRRYSVKNYQMVVGGWLYSASVIDASITATVVFLLARARRDTSVEATKSMVNTVIHVTLENNLLPGVVSIIAAALFTTNDGTSDWQFAMLPFLGKLYFAALLASLNQRRRMNKLRFSLSQTESQSLRSQSRSRTCTRPGPQPIVVTFGRSIEIKSERRSVDSAEEQAIDYGRGSFSMSGDIAQPDQVALSLRQGWETQYATYARPPMSRRSSSLSFRDTKSLSTPYSPMRLEGGISENYFEEEGTRSY